MNSRWLCNGNSLHFLLWPIIFKKKKQIQRSTLYENNNNETRERKKSMWLHIKWPLIVRYHIFYYLNGICARCLSSLVSFYSNDISDCNRYLLTYICTRMHLNLWNCDHVTSFSLAWNWYLDKNESKRPKVTARYEISVKMFIKSVFAMAFNRWKSHRTMNLFIKKSSCSHKMTFCIIISSWNGFDWFPFKADLKWLFSQLTPFPW